MQKKSKYLVSRPIFLHFPFQFIMVIILFLYTSDMLADLSTWNWYNYLFISRLIQNKHQMLRQFYCKRHSCGFISHSGKWNVYYFHFLALEIITQVPSVTYSAIKICSNIYKIINNLRSLALLAQNYWFIIQKKLL